MSESNSSQTLADVIPLFGDRDEQDEPDFGDGDDDFFDELDDFDILAQLVRVLCVGMVQQKDGHWYFEAHRNDVALNDPEIELLFKILPTGLIVRRT
jgi:hypothetical protein